MKIKIIRNLKNTIENLMFVSVVLTIGCIFASLLYLAFNILNVAVFTAKAWGVLLIADMVLFTVSQGCDIWIWWIKTKKTRMTKKRRVKLMKKNRISPLMYVKGFCKALAHYCF